MRQARQDGRTWLIEAADLRCIIDAAGTQLRAMILLGINAGYGNSDIAGLPIKALDLKGGWSAYPRPKTAILRRCPLWPETVAAVREALDQRPKPKDPADAGLVFLTVQGRRWVRVHTKEVGKPPVPVDTIRLEFDKVLTRLGLKQRGRSFYFLRHTHRTVSDTAKDQPAADYIMGHVPEGMSDTYRERIDDERLVAVTDAVHAWLWLKSEK